MPEYCVTGGTGFIAGHLIKALIEEGHAVRATVRDPENIEKVGFLWEFHGAKERLKLVKADLLENGSFDEAIQGVDGVFHIASPVFASCDDKIQGTLIDSCIKGTENVLLSCSRSPTLKRVVLTSSCSAIRYRHDAQQASPLNESHWSDPEYCKKYELWYAYAKTLGEKEAWRIANEFGIDLVVVNPSVVIGPLISPEPSSTLLLTLSLIRGSLGEYPNQTIGFVHIHDVVAAHLLAMTEPNASGRLICSGPVAHWSEIIKMLRNMYPTYPYVSKCSTEGANIIHSLDTTKILKLGLSPFRTLEQMFVDCIKSFQERNKL